MYTILYAYCLTANLQTITSVISVLKQYPEHRHAQQQCPDLDKSKANATLLLDKALDIVWRLFTASKNGKRLNIRSCSMLAL